ncbi:hypothetical protein Y032_0744g1996 [Ancylostoma ceylanicum]|nr:hypothetical protein Y032_0744g1996 [Ancylostoma ceylanicum]
MNVAMIACAGVSCFVGKPSEGVTIEAKQLIRMCSVKLREIGTELSFGQSECPSSGCHNDANGAAFW